MCQQGWYRETIASSLFREGLFLILLFKGGNIDMKEQLAALQDEDLEDVKKAKTTDVLQIINVAYLGRKSALTSVLRGKGKLLKGERTIVGELANRVRAEFAKAIYAKKET